MSLIEGDSLYRKPIQFEIENEETLNSPQNMKLLVTVHINALEREDGSGESWIFRGQQLVGHTHSEPSKSLKMWKEAEGYYSSRTRQGWVTQAEK